MLKVLRKIADWGNETVHIPGWLIFGLMVFVFPAIFIYVGWTFPICQHDDQAQCLQNIPNVRIYMTLASLGFPGIIGVMFLKFRALQKHLDKITERSSEQ